MTQATQTTPATKMYPVYTYHAAELVRFRVILLHLIGRQEKRGRTASAEYLANLHEQIQAIENILTASSTAEVVYLSLYDRRLVELAVKWVRANLPQN